MSPEVRRLLEEGWITPAAIAHAEAVAQRGHSLVPIADLLVELEHLDPDDLARVRAQSPAPIEAPSLAIAGDDVTRLVNVLLLRAQRPGSAFRIERGGVRASDESRFDEWIPLAPNVVEAMGVRLRAMAGVDPEAPSVDGAISIRTTSTDFAFQAWFEATDDGPRALVRRHTSWRGHGLPNETRWEGFRRVRDTAGSDAVARARALLREAEALGDDATIERVSALAELGAALDRAGAHEEAASLATRALEIAREKELGARAMGSLAAHAASLQCRDLSRRVALFDRAEAWMRAPGLGRGRCVWVPLDIAMSERARGHHEAALTAAARALADDAEWIGAQTRWSVRAWLETTLARAALGDRERARASADEAGRIGAFVHAPAWEVAWARAAAAEDRDAIAAWRRAIETRPRSEGEEDAPFIALGLARALDRLDRGDEARGEAQRALAEASVGLGAAARAELEAIARRAPYR